VKKDLHPGIVAVIVVVVLVLVGWFGFQRMKPAAYDPSPGVGAGIVESENAAASVQPAGNSPGEQAYQQSLQGGGSVPGFPQGGAAPQPGGTIPAGGSVHVAPD